MVTAPAFILMIIVLTYQIKLIHPSIHRAEINAPLRDKTQLEEALKRTLWKGHKSRGKQDAK